MTQRNGPPCPEDDISPLPLTTQFAQDPLAIFRSRPLPRWALVRQRFDPTEIGDVLTGVEAALRDMDPIEPGLRVCLAVGSRGIDRLDQVVHAVVLYLRAQGAEVFVVPAMGSHGGATADGQLAVLADLGIREDTIGCEIRSSMDTVEIGRIDGRVPVFIDRYAYEEADLIVPINRVKPHTDFTGPTESGLLKMIAIGLGNQRGADTFHREGFAAFAELIPAVAAHTISQVRIPFGLALIENGYARLARIEAVPGDRILHREVALRDEADALLARLPVSSLDLLIIDQIGKDISGLGMDSNVVGRYYTGPTGRGPLVQRIVVRGLTEHTQGNAVGIGMADVVLRDAVEAMDPLKTYMNSITAKTPEGARVPMTAGNDRDAVAFALASAIKVDPDKARIVRILDTKRLGWLYASEPLLAEIGELERCDIVSGPAPIRFDGHDRFIDAWPG
jgi:Uncharacterized conserved protein (DUF2088).